MDGVLPEVLPGHLDGYLGIWMGAHGWGFAQAHLFLEVSGLYHGFDHYTYVHIRKLTCSCGYVFRCSKRR